MEQEQLLLTQAHAYAHANTDELQHGKTPVWNSIYSLLAKSKYNRSSINHPECIIQNETGIYAIRSVTSTDELTLNAAYALLSSVFNQAELETREVMQQYLDGKTPFGTQTQSKNRVFVLTSLDEPHDVLGILTTGIMPLLHDDGTESEHVAVLRGYGVSKPELQKTGFARELYISALIDAEQVATQQGKILRLAGSESRDAAEPAWNSIGLRRIYKKSHEGDLYELPYLQPPLEFDSATGEAKQNMDSVPEHLMIDGFGGEPTQEEVMQLIDAYYRWNNLKPREAFTNTDAYERHRELIKVYHRALNNFLRDGSNISFMTQQERKNDSSGRRIVTHQTTN